MTWIASRLYSCLFLSTAVCFFHCDCDLLRFEEKGAKNALDFTINFNKQRYSKYSPTDSPPPNPALTGTPKITTVHRDEGSRGRTCYVTIRIFYRRSILSFETIPRQQDNLFWNSLHLWTKFFLPNSDCAVRKYILQRIRGFYFTMEVYYTQSSIHNR
jgi:hypothetical protein